MTQPDSARPGIVLYDDDCGFCKWSLNKLLAWDRSSRLHPVAIQSAEGQELLTTRPPELRLDSWHLVSANGELHSAGAAAGPLLRLLPGGRPLARLTEALPGATERVYRLVAGNRTRISKALGIDSSCEIRR